LLVLLLVFPARSDDEFQAGGVVPKRQLQQGCHISTDGCHAVVTFAAVTFLCSDDELQAGGVVPQWQLQRGSHISTDDRVKGAGSDQGAL
jgi:hypothetical protein